MIMLELQHLVDASEVYKLVIAWNFYAPIFTGKLFSFACYSTDFILFLCVFKQNIQYLHFLPSYFTTQ